MASNNQSLVSSLRLVIIMLGVMAVSSTQTCHNTYCSGTSSIGTYKRPIAIRFPFQFYNQNPPHLRCGYPGFELSCKQNIIDNDNDLILTLPSGDYLVTSIFYDQQTLLIDDPDYCLPKRLIDRQFNVTGTPFIINNLESFTFLKCSPTVIPNEQMRVVPCLSDFVQQLTVMAIPTHEFLRLQPISSCSVMSTTMVPTRNTFQSSLHNSIELNWYEPDCRYCELCDGICGFRSSTSQDIACYDSSGLKKRIALTGMICLAGVVLLAYGSIQYCRYRKGDIDHHESESSSEAPSSQHVVASSNVVVNKGLNGMTIESYPKTVLDKSIEMPKLSDNTCSICLTEYQPRETLRTIPDCNHYFHVSCIDEWLRINATCPLCRNLRNESH